VPGKFIKIFGGITEKVSGFSTSPAGVFPFRLGGKVEALSCHFCNIITVFGGEIPVGGIGREVSAFKMISTIIIVIIRIRFKTAFMLGLSYRVFAHPEAIQLDLMNRLLPFIPGFSHLEDTAGYPDHLKRDTIPQVHGKIGMGSYNIFTHTKLSFFRIDYNIFKIHILRKQL
jgi:hypothetical protein